jgi:hypothetical protein
MIMSQTQSDIFPLTYPFTTVAGVKVEQITLKRLTLKDLKQAQKVSKNPADWDDLLIARSSGMLPEDIDGMDLADYMTLQDRFQEITGLGKKSATDNTGAGAAGEVVPLPAGGD